MNRWIAIALLACFASTSSYAKSKQGSATVQCSCTCTTITGGGYGPNNGFTSTTETKTWGWSGDRAGCQGFNGGNCNIGNKTGGSLSGCDVVVSHPLPGRVPGTQPGQQRPM